MRRSRRFLLALPLLAAGCLTSAPPVPKDNFHRIVVRADQAGNPAKAPLNGVVSVAPFEADGLLRERPLIFAVTDDGLTLRQHDYHHWADVPSRMLRAQLIEYLRASGFARMVVTPDLRVASDYEVRGRLKRLEQNRAGGRPMVTIEIELALVRLSDRRALVIDSYTVSRPSGGTGVDAGVAALNLAAADLFGRFLGDARGSYLAAAESRTPD